MLFISFQFITFVPFFESVVNLIKIYFLFLVKVPVLCSVLSAPTLNSFFIILTKESRLLSTKIEDFRFLFTTLKGF